MSIVLRPFLLAVVLVGLTRVAGAAPLVGRDLRDVPLVDSWDRTDALASHQGRPMLLLYEDKGSGGVNSDLKKELAEVAQDGRYKALITLIPVADVSSYDFWPVRSVAKRTVQKQSLATRTNIYCDWTGQVREKLGLMRKTSNVVLFDKTGKVIFAYAGALSAELRTALFGLLREQVESMLEP